jgi:hypothetical protein
MECINNFRLWMEYSSCGCGCDLADWIDCLTANAEKVATILDSIPASTDTLESEGRQMKQCRIKY